MRVLEMWGMDDSWMTLSIVKTIDRSRNYITLIFADEAI